MNSSPRSVVSSGLVRLLVLPVLLATGWPAEAQPTIVSTVPTNMAAGVSPTAPVVFTFSEAMNPTATVATFMDVNGGYPFPSLPSSPTWSGGNNVLTCTPASPWPANHMVMWSVTGRSATGTTLGGDTAGFFTAASTDTGCDTNATMPSFTVAKSMQYAQTSAGAPILDPIAPYCFLACNTIPCPRTATNVSLQMPTGAVRNMVLSPIPGHLTLPDCGYTNQTAFETAYTNGNYTFTIQSVASNQPVTVNFPSSYTQPPAPHLTNFVQGQWINAGLPFVLAWDPWSGGTVADCVYVEIYGGVFKTPDVGSPGASNGTATAVVIPAGTFQTNHSYSGLVSFYRYNLATNGTSHVSLTYRCTSTEFTLTTTNCPLVITNWTWTGGNTFSFEVTCSPGQALVAEYKANLLPGLWQTLSTTNSSTQRVRFTHPNAITNHHLFYHVRTGS